VDFAYHVHTVLGNQMVGAKVNGKLVDPDHLLGNAEVVEILSYNGQPTTVSVTRHHVSTPPPPPPPPIRERHLNRV
jgi:GTP pyrophosphokinase